MIIKISPPNDKPLVFNSSSIEIILNNRVYQISSPSEDHLLIHATPGLHKSKKPLQVSKQAYKIEIF